MEMRRFLGFADKRYRRDGTPEGVDLLARDAIERAYPELRYARLDGQQAPEPGSEQWPGVDPAVLNRARAAVSRSFKRLEDRGLVVRHRQKRWAGVSLTEAGQRQVRTWATSFCLAAALDTDDWAVEMRYRSTAEKMANARLLLEGYIAQVMEEDDCDRDTALATIEREKKESPWQ